MGDAKLESVRQDIHRRKKELQDKGYTGKEIKSDAEVKQLADRMTLMRATLNKLRDAAVAQAGADASSAAEEKSVSEPASAGHSVCTAPVGFAVVSLAVL